MSRRTTELFLLLAASPVIVLLFVLAIMNDGRPLNIETLAVPLGLFAAFLVSHLAIRWLAPNADPALLPIVFVLSGIGIAFVMRLSPSLAPRQVLWLFVGIAAMIATLLLVRSVRKLGNYKYLLMLLGIVLLLLPAFVGTEIYGSKIWLHIGSFSFQPGEIAKVLIVLFLAGYLADNREMLSVGGRRIGNFTIPDLRTLAPLLIMWAISLVIVVFERDLGSALLFFGLFLVMIYVATGRKFYVLVGAGLAVVGGIAAFLIFDHVQLRINIWLDLFAHREEGYQLIQGLYSLADGGLFGSGIGRGMADYIPLVSSDFIFDAIGEEMGLLGASGILLLFVLFCVRGFTIAARANSDVDAFASVGLTAAIALQAFVIVGGVTRLIPLTGVTLPFMSQGGSSLLASFIIVGLLLRSSDSATGIEKEMLGVSTFDGGILGRVTLGKRLTLLITGFACLFALLIGNLTWHMVINAQTVQKDPYNGHTLERTTNIQRGALLTSDGVVLARSVQDESTGRWQRNYPEGSFAAHVVGYNSPAFGAAGAESTYADILTGKNGFGTWESALNAFAGREVPGNDAYLTIDSRIQAAAEQALAGAVGGVVALDAASGDVLALASAPSYDNNTVEDLLSAGGDDGSGLGGGSGLLFNRATQGLYAPGSTFKTVTLASALTKDSVTLNTNYDSPSSIDIGNAPITNFDNYAHGNVSLLKGYELSSNTVFAQVADGVGAEQLCETAGRFGFNRDLNTDFATATSLMPNPAEMTQWETAWAGVGQPVGEHKSPAGPQATVLQMALVGAGIANNGVVMKPHLLERVMSAEGVEVQTGATESLGEAVSPSVASKVQQAMEGVVKEGTGTAAQINGYTVRGKTGTAQTNNPKDNSWFVGYVEVGGRSIVVAIVLEETAGGAATPKARDILQAAIEVYE
jgi:peptidoglycan glycosyltransferase